MIKAHFPNYVFRDGVDPVAYHLLSLEPSEIVHEACAKTSQDREFPLYPEDVEAMRCLEPIDCFVCEGRIAEAVELHECERCSGTGEVEGYGGNNTYCGHCAGSGKTWLNFEAVA